MSQASTVPQPAAPVAMSRAQAPAVLGPVQDRAGETPEIQVIWVLGELDSQSAPRVRQRLRAAINRSTAPVIKLDVAGVEFIDVRGIREILEARSLLEERGSRMVISRPSHAVSRLLGLLELDASVDPEAR